MHHDFARTTPTASDEARADRKEIIETARSLLGGSGDQANVDKEYQRALVEMTTNLLGLPMDQADVVGAALGIPDFERFDY